MNSTARHGHATLEKPFFEGLLCTANLDHAEVAVEEAPVLRVLAALDVVGHGQEDVAGGRVVEVEHVLRELLIGVINPTHPGIYKYMSRSDESTCMHLLQ